MNQHKVVVQLHLTYWICNIGTVPLPMCMNGISYTTTLKGGEGILQLTNISEANMHPWGRFVCALLDSLFSTNILSIPPLDSSKYIMIKQSSVPLHPGERCAIKPTHLLPPPPLIPLFPFDRGRRLRANICENCWLSFEGIEPSEWWRLGTDGSTISSLDD